MVKINDTTTFPNTGPALADHVPGTDVSNTTNDAAGETVTFTMQAVMDLFEANMTVPTSTAAAYRTSTILSSTSNAEGASLIGVEDVGTYFTGTDVEAVLAEIGALLPAEAGADVTDATNVAAAGAPIITSGAGAPVSTPAAVGDVYIDTTGDVAYVATGTASSADWDATLVSGGDLGTPSAGVATNLTGTAAGLTAGNVTTNANLTGHVTSTGNAAVLGSFTKAQLDTAVSDATLQAQPSEGAFADGDKTKLDGIETAADVTDATNVGAAGAPIITSGAVAPTSTPGKVGDVYIDTVADKAYVATGTASSADWDEVLTDASGTTLTDTATAVGDSVPFFDADDSSNPKQRTWTNIIADIALATASSTTTFTNKTFDANATGNALSNVDVADLAAGTDGELITWDAAGLPTTVAVGTSGHVLTSNGVGAAPTFQAQAGGGDMSAATYDPAAISEQLVGLTATQTLSGKTLTAPKLANGGFIADANGNELIIGTTTASAVNEITVANGATGNAPTITATGETNIGLSLQASGTGNVTVGNYVFDADQTVGAGQDNYVLTYDNGAGTIQLEAAAGGGLSNVVEDTTPQLGGNLDINGNSIVSVSAGNIAITPDTTGSIVLDGLNWPQADGSADQVLKTDGAGQLSWVANSGSGLANVVDDTTPQLGGMLDVNGQAIGDGTRELLTFTEDASAVNHVNIENEATGAGPIVSAVGDDTNIDLILNAKGSGAVKVGAADVLVSGGALGTPSGGTLTNATGLPISSGVSGLGTNVATFLATPSSANLRAALTDETGTGAAVFAGGALGTPASGTATNLTGLPLTTGVTGTLPVANGGSGRATATTAYGLLAAGTTATGAHQTLSAGATTAILVGGGASALPVWTTATGSGAPVRGTSPTLVTPVLGTPTSGTLTNCTGLPVAGITASTSTALGVGSVELGHASDTTLARGAAGRLTVEGVNVPTISSTDTLTNKDISNANNTYRAASATVTGAVELATVAELDTGTDTTRAITPDVLAGSDFGKEVVTVCLFDDSEDVATGDGAGDQLFRVPSKINGWNLVEVAAYVQTAGTTGTTDIQIHNVTAAADVLSTKLTIDSAETDTNTALTAAAIDPLEDDVATADKYRFDVDAVSTTAPKGLWVELTFQAP